MNPRIIVSVIAISHLALGAAIAEAAPFVERLLVRDGKDAGETNRDQNGRDNPRQAVYPGGEQAQLTQLASGEILIFGMGSYRLNGQLPNNRNQMFCASVEMTTEGPQVTSLQYVTNNNGNRYRNAHHPRVTAIFDREAVAVTYNYAPDNHANAYQVVFGAGCQQMSERTRIVAKNNDNCSETGQNSETVAYQDATTARLFSAHGCNGNGDDDSWAALTEIVKTGANSYQVNQITDDIRTEREEERSRPDVIPNSIPNLGVVCLTAGNTQPPNRGVYCSGYDTQTGERLWRKAVAEKTDEIYKTQIRATPIFDSYGKPTDKAYVTWQELDKRDRNEKGTAKLMASTISFSRDGMALEGVPQSDVYPGGDATHAAQCSTLWGQEGQEESRVFLISGSINGNAAALSTAHLLGWDDSNRTVYHQRKVGLGAAIDTGWLSNLYGENPNTQGRNFIQCLGNVTNPYYGVEGAYQSDVKSFIAIAAHTRRMDPVTGYAEDKLATELVLVPAVTAPDAPPLPDPDGGDSDDEEPEPDPEPEPDQVNKTGGLGGCAVGEGNGGASLLLVGLGLLFAIRRRRS